MPISFKKRLCHLCQNEHMPMWVHRMGDKRLCVDCIKSVNNASADLPEEHREILPLVKSFLLNINIVFVTRVVGYISSFSLISPSNRLLYPAMQGAVAGDAVSWLILSFFDMPFRGAGFAIEFLAYSGVIGIYAIQKEHVLKMPTSPEDFALAFLAFFTIGIAKISWWALKTFVVEIVED